MADISSIVALFEGVKHATDIIKVLKESNTTLEKAGTKMQLANLYDHMADIKIQAANVKEESMKKDEEIRELKSLLHTKSKVIYKAPFYFLMDQQNNENRYCQKCFDADQKLIHVQQTGPSDWRCRQCDSWYDANPVSSFQKPSIGAVLSDYDPFE